MSYLHLISIESFGEFKIVHCRKFTHTLCGRGQFEYFLQNDFR